ncbi:MAG: hypothetical protein Q8R60_11160 [Mycobacteriales bacterium]|nr:hypothetical protein [Mycobacteriales bacterium]
MSDLLQAMAAAVRDLDTDHVRVAAVLAGDLVAQPPLDPALAALCADLVSRRYREPGLTGLGLLAEAAVEHGAAVVAHLDWLDARRTSARPATLGEAIPLQLDRVAVDLLTGRG